MADEADKTAPSGATSDTALTQGKAVGTDAQTAVSGAGGTGAAASAVLATGEGEDTGKQIVPADFPDDWRERMAEGNEDVLKVLKRYTSPKTAAAGFLAARQRAAQVRDPLPDGATPEQATAWRKANGLPETPADYEKALPEGLVIGEVDKPIIDRYFETAHKMNLDPKVTGGIIDWYYKEREAAAQAHAEADVTFGAESQDVLRAEWGGEYRGRVNSVANMLKGMGEDTAGLIATARASDGRLLIDHAPVFKVLAEIAHELNPLATFVPGTGMSGAAALESEIETIRKILRDEPPKYYGDPKMQDRFAELLAAQERAGGKKAA